MKFLRQVSMGALATFVSVAIVFGAMLEAFVEVGARLANPMVIVTQPTTPLVPSWTPRPGTPATLPAIETPPATLMPTMTPATVCDPPAGWRTIITVQPGDTLESIAETYSTTVKMLIKANCLPSTDLIPNMRLYVPSFVAVPTEYRCGPPSGWVFYTVRSGDTLYWIASLFGTTIQALQEANCMGDSTFIRAGQQLYVPYKLIVTPWFSPTPTLTLRPTHTFTPIPTATYTPPPTPSYTPVDTATPIPFTSTPKPSPTPTLPFVEPTITTTATPTHTPIPIPTDTPKPTPTYTPLPTVTEDLRPTPSSTPTATNTEIPLPTLTATPTSTNTDTPSISNLVTPTPQPVLLHLPAFPRVALISDPLSELTDFLAELIATPY